jgi:hypothetical protein
MKMTKKRWARYALPEGFAEHGYPKDSSYLLLADGARKRVVAFS